MNDRKHWRRIGLSLLLATLVQGWMLARNTVPAQDAVLYVQTARQLAHNSVIEILRSNVQHPLYPLLIWGQHQLVGDWLGQEGVSWVRSAQLVSAFASILLVLPMYTVGIRLANPFLATAATAIFSLLPLAARMGADALSESTYLFFFVVGLCACAEFWVTRSSWWLLVSGIAAGLAFLARPEALLLPAAFIVTLGIVQCWAHWRLPWRSVASGLIFLIAGTSTVAAPYILITGKLTPKRSLMLLPGGNVLWSLQNSTVPDRSPNRFFSDGSVISPPSASVSLPAIPEGKLDFGLKHSASGPRIVGYAGAIKHLGRELIAGLHYVFALLVLAGLIQSPRQPVNLLVTVLAVVFVTVLVQFASRSGYLSSRHVITLVCLGTFVAARGSWFLAGVLAKKLDHQASSHFAVASSAPHQAGSKLQVRMAGALLVLGCITCLPHSLAPLHQSREPHIEAGRWLASNAPPGSIVLDSRGWASLCFGLRAYNYSAARLAFQDPRLAYVIVESGEADDERARGKTLRYLLSIGGEPIAEFPATDGTNESVRVYRWNPAAIAAAAGPRSQILRAN